MLAFVFQLPKSENSVRQLVLDQGDKVRAMVIYVSDRLIDGLFDYDCALRAAHDSLAGNDMAMALYPSE